MAVAVNDLIDKVEIILQDTTNVRWVAVELIGWLNDGQMAIVREKPEASVTTESVALVAGTKQTLPTTGIVLIDVIRNMGTDGSTPGFAIRIISRRILDAQVPDWHLTSGEAAVVKHYMFDGRNPKVYYIYPPSDATTQVEIIYSDAPTVVAAGENISIDDVYESILIDYVLYRAYSKDADYAANAARAQAHYTAVMQALGLQEQAELATSPSKGLTPTSVPV